MPFQKGNKLGFKSERVEPLDATPICFRGWLGQKEKLKKIPNWQDRAREFVAQLICEAETIE